MAIDIKTLNHNQLNDLIARAKTRQEDLIKEKEGKVRDKVLALVKAEGFTIEDLFGLGSTGARKTRRKIKPKYRNPEDGSMTWTGRGKRPRWFNDALTAGKKEKDLLIA